MIKRHKFIIGGALILVAGIAFIVYRRRKAAADAAQAAADAASSTDPSTDPNAAIDSGLTDPSLDGTTAYGPSDYVSGGILGPAGGNAPAVVSYSTPAQGAPQPPDVATVSPSPGATVDITVPPQPLPPATSMGSGGPPASTPTVHTIPRRNLSSGVGGPTRNTGSAIFATDAAPSRNTGQTLTSHSANYHPNAAHGNKFRWTDGKWHSKPQPGQHYY